MDDIIINIVNKIESMVFFNQITKKDFGMMEIRKGQNIRSLFEVGVRQDFT